MASAVAVLALAATLIVAGCGLLPTPSTSPVPSPRPTASASSVEPTPVPTGEAPAFPRLASVERDGVRLTIELDRNPMPAGEPTWVTSTITNTGPDELVWLVDGCEVNAVVGGAMPALAWRPGRVWPDPDVAAHKDWATEAIGVEGGGPIFLSFVPQPFIGRDRFACASIGIIKRLGPGDSASQRAQWSGHAGFLLGPPPSGAVALSATFGLYWRATAGEPATGEYPELRVDLVARVEGGAPPPPVQPAEAIDAALADPAFGRWLLDHELHNGDWFVRYAMDEVAWLVSIQVGPGAPERVAVIDGATSVVREIRGG